MSSTGSIDSGAGHAWFAREVSKAIQSPTEQPTEATQGCLNAAREQFFRSSTGAKMSTAHLRQPCPMAGSLKQGQDGQALNPVTAPEPQPQPPESVHAMDNTNPAWPLDSQIAAITRHPLH